MTPQPKDMEQLKNEVREELESGLDTSSAEIKDFLHEFFIYFDRYIDKSHRSGRESMRSECVEGARSEKVNHLPKEDINLHVVWNNAIRATISALKKIKL